MPMKSLFIFLFGFSVVTFSQSEIPQDYFGNPLDIPMILSGSFGELRSNHFHSGLDIKTQQKVGFPIYAPADGVVSRLKVSHYGYGKALYIKHPNGYSTVYAHLQKYAGKIQEYVKNQQYKKETYEIELFPEGDMLSVTKGEIIGYTGNSGGSGGPHLHYEIRDGASRPMNPMLFGINIPDTKKPLINSVFVYPSSEDALVAGSPNRTKLRLIRQKNGNYKTETLEAIGTIGFGISTYDQQNGASNKNGTYQINTQLNGKLIYNILFDKFSFGETRYLNRFVDYEYFKTNKSRIQKLFREENNPLSIITQAENDGYVIVEQGLDLVYTIVVKDFKNNTVTISIPIKGKEMDSNEASNKLITDDLIKSDQATSITKGKFNIYFPQESLYEDTFLTIEAMGDTLKLHEDRIPIHKNISISVDASNYDEKDLKSLYLGRLNYKGEPYYQRTYKKGTKLTTKTRTFGTYAIATDTIAPVITPINFSDGKWISKNKTLKLKAEDVHSGVSSYRATLNGKFILTEYDYKKDVLVYDFDDNVVSDTENNLKVIVIDNVGNSTTFEATFFRKTI